MQGIIKCVWAGKEFEIFNLLKDIEKIRQELLKAILKNGL